MKKYLLIVGLLILLNYQNVSAYEEIIPIRSKDKFIGVKSLIKVDSNDEKVKIESVAVKGLNFYARLNKNDEYKIKIEVDKNYKYIKNSIKIKKYKYDGKSTIYRTINTPLKKLYKYKNINLSDEVLNKKLKEKGYKGIEELHKYYEDYYKCDKLTNKEIKKIIKGKLTYIKENNYEINKIAYDYYYKTILIVENKDLNIELSLNNKYYKDAYQDYLYDLDISFYLKKR